MALPLIPIAIAGAAVLLTMLSKGGGGSRLAKGQKTPLGKFVLTWYSFQDNTPVNSARSSSGRPLVPYVSVAIPFRLLSTHSHASGRGKLDYGDRLYVEFLAGRTMPNGRRHTGWVQIDDFCGDSGDDAYCHQTLGGEKYPNVDLYVGDFTAAGIDPKTCSGPAGGGAELTNVFALSGPGALHEDYGGRTIGTGKCGDLAAAKLQQGDCWTYTPPSESVDQCR